MGIVSWWFVPEERWLTKDFIVQAQRGIEVDSDDGASEK